MAEAVGDHAFLKPGGELRRHAAKAEKDAEEMPERAADLLRQVATALREGAALYAVDPTLHRDSAGRERPLDLLCELGRQSRLLIRQAMNGNESATWPIKDRWAEADALCSRMPIILAECRAAARPDHAMPAASQAISRMRLVSALSYVRRAADDVHSALRPIRRGPTNTGSNTALSRASPSPVFPAEPGSQPSTAPTDDGRYNV